MLVCNNISFPVRLYVCDVKAPLLGLHDIFDSGSVLHINGKDSSSVERSGENEPLYHHRSHLFINAMPCYGFRHRSPSTSPLGSAHSTTWFLQRPAHPDEQRRTSTSCRRSTTSTNTTSSHSTITTRTRCTLIDTSTISFLVPCLPTSKRPRWPTSKTTSAGGEHQHRTARLHLHALSTSSTSEDRETSHLHDTYGHRGYNRTWIGGAYIKERLYASSRSRKIIGSSSMDLQKACYNQTTKHLQCSW